MAELRENKTKKKLERGEVATMLTGGYDTPDMVDFLRQFGFDSILIEGEHGPVDFGHISDLSRVCELWDMTSVVKVDLNLPGVIYRTFDLGAQGIIVPHVALKTPALWWTPPNTAPLGIAARLEVVRVTAWRTTLTRPTTKRWLPFSSRISVP